MSIPVIKPIQVKERSLKSSSKEFVYILSDGTGTLSNMINFKEVGNILEPLATLLYYINLFLSRMKNWS